MATASVFESQPVSQELIEMLLQKLQGKKITPEMTGVKRGGPSELIFLTAEGDVSCPVNRRGNFICLKLPSGKVFGIPEEEIEEQPKSGP